MNRLRRVLVTVASCLVLFVAGFSSTQAQEAAAIRAAADSTK